jgi:putative addiction module component (TIGR02574 family)
VRYNCAMNAATRQVLAQAKRLPPADRAELLECLFSSLDEPIDPLIDQAWSKEAEDRLAAYQAGQLNSTSAEDVLGRINREDGPR